MKTTGNGRGTVRAARLLLVLAASLAAGEVHAEDTQDLSAILQFIRLGGVLASVPVVMLFLFLLSLVERLSDRLSERFPHRRLGIQKFQTATRFFVYVAMIAIVISLSIQIDATTMAVIGGALAFAVGFAMRDLVASFIAGITIIFDRPFQVGDRVSYAGEYGDIVKIGLRSVRLLTLDHNLITIPNNKVFTDITASGNYGELEMQVAMDFYIGVDQDVGLASELVREACLCSPYVFLGRPIPVLARQVILQDYVAFHIKARPYVFDCTYEKAFETSVHRRVQGLFREHGIGQPAVLHRSMAERRIAVVAQGDDRAT